MMNPLTCRISACLLLFWYAIFSCQILLTGATLHNGGNGEIVVDDVGVDALYWKDLSVQTSQGTYLLQNCSGCVRKGHVAGILGPSGAGKSTMLSALGGSISSKLQVNGEIFLYDSTYQSKQRVQLQNGDVAWMQQKDVFFTMLTVEETLELAAFLELPKFTRSERARRVSETMHSLGLIKLRNRTIGDSSNQGGLSGGERRRLSLALELISSPQLFIGDEPTSGLDSNLSEKVVKLLKQLVRQRNIPCIVSIHQPKSSIWRMLDTVVLMAPGGRICYVGETGTALSYFANLGYHCPEATNPAEFLLDLVSIDSEDMQIAIKDEERISRLATEFASSQEQFICDVEDLTLTANDQNVHYSSSSPSSIVKRGRSPFRPIQRFGRLLLRSVRQNIRNHRVNGLRLLTSVGNAYLFTNIFKSIKKGIATAKSVADRTALLTFGIINMSMMGLMKTIDLFAKEKPVVQREQLRRQYTSLEYLLSKIVAEIPLDTAFVAIFTSVLKMTSGIRISWSDLTGAFALMTVTGASMGFAIGSLSPTSEVAMSAGVPIMVLLMTVGVINPSGVDPSEPEPAVVGALKQLSPIAYAIKAVCLAEYTGMEFQLPGAGNGKKQNILSKSRSVLKDLPKMGGLALVKNGEQVLNALGLSDETYEGSMRHLAVLSVANLVLSWIGLMLQGR